MKTNKLGKLLVVALFVLLFTLVLTVSVGAKNTDVTTPEQLTTALGSAQSGDTVTVTASLTFTADTTINVPAGVTVQGNVDAMFKIASTTSAKLTVTGAGTIKSGFGSNNSGLFWFGGNASTAEISGVTIDAPYVALLCTAKSATLQTLTVTDADITCRDIVNSNSGGQATVNLNAGADITATGGIFSDGGAWTADTLVVNVNGASVKARCFATNGDASAITLAAPAKLTVNSGSVAVENYHPMNNITVTCTGDGKVTADGMSYPMGVVTTGGIKNETTSMIYDTLAQAIAEASSGDTIAILADISVSANIDIGAKTLIFTGAEGVHVLFENDAKLNLTDGANLTFEGSLTWYQLYVYANYTATGTEFSTVNVTFNGGVYKRGESSSARGLVCIDNSVRANVAFLAGEFHITGTDAVVLKMDSVKDSKCVTTTVNVEGGTFYMDGTALFKAGGPFEDDKSLALDVTISDGAFHCTLTQGTAYMFSATDWQGKLKVTIKGGTFDAVQSPASTTYLFYNNADSLNAFIEGGTFDGFDFITWGNRGGDSDTAIASGSGLQLTVTDGTFTNIGTFARVYDGFEGNWATTILNISGGKFTTLNAFILVQNPKFNPGCTKVRVTVSGGTFTTERFIQVDNNAQATVEVSVQDGTLTSTLNDGNTGMFVCTALNTVMKVDISGGTVTCTNGAIIGSSGKSAVTISGGVINANHLLNINSSGVHNITVKGTADVNLSSAVFRDPPANPTACAITLEGGSVKARSVYPENKANLNTCTFTVTGGTYNGHNAVKNENIAQIGDTYYPSLKAAVEAAADGDTILLLGSHVITETVVINKKVTITSPTDAEGVFVSNGVTKRTLQWVGFDTFRIEAGADVTFAGNIHFLLCTMYVYPDGDKTTTVTFGGNVSFDNETNTYTLHVPDAAVGGGKLIVNIQENAYLRAFHVLNAQANTAYEVNVTGGSLESTDSSIIWINDGSAVINVTGGNFLGTSIALRPIDIHADINISGGTFNINDCVIYANRISGKINITGGTVIKAKHLVLINGGKNPTVNPSLDGVFVQANPTVKNQADIWIVVNGMQGSGFTSNLFHLENCGNALLEIGGETNLSTAGRIFYRRAVAEDAANTSTVVNITGGTLVSSNRYGFEVPGGSGSVKVNNFAFNISGGTITMTNETETAWNGVNMFNLWKWVVEFWVNISGGVMEWEDVDSATAKTTTTYFLAAMCGNNQNVTMTGGTIRGFDNVFWASRNTLNVTMGAKDATAFPSVTANNSIFCVRAYNWEADHATMNVTVWGGDYTVTNGTDESGIFFAKQDVCPNTANAKNIRPAVNATVNGGTFQTGGYLVNLVQTTGTLTMNGGTLTSINDTAIRVYGAPISTVHTETVTVHKTMDKDGNYADLATAAPHFIVNIGGTVSLKAKQCVISMEGNIQGVVNVSGGTLECTEKTADPWKYGIIAVNNDDAVNDDWTVVNISAGVFKTCGDNFFAIGSINGGTLCMNVNIAGGEFIGTHASGLTYVFRNADWSGRMVAVVTGGTFKTENAAAKLRGIHTTGISSALRIGGDAVMTNLRDVSWLDRNDNKGITLTVLVEGNAKLTATPDQEYEGMFMGNATDSKEVPNPPTINLSIKGGTITSNVGSLVEADGVIFNVYISGGTITTTLKNNNLGMFNEPGVVKHAGKTELNVFISGGTVNCTNGPVFGSGGKINATVSGGTIKAYWLLNINSDGMHVITVTGNANVILTNSVIRDWPGGGKENTIYLKGGSITADRIYAEQHANYAKTRFIVEGGTYNGHTYVAGEDGVAQIGNVYFPSLQAAIDSITDDSTPVTITLIGAHTITETVNLNKNVIITGGDKDNVVFVSNAVLDRLEANVGFSTFILTPGKNVTFTGYVYYLTCTIYLAPEAGTDTSLTFGGNVFFDSDYSSYTVRANGGTAGGNVTFNVIENAHIKAVHCFNMVTDATYEFNMSGGTLESTKSSCVWVNNGTITVNISGGHFAGGSTAMQVVNIDGTFNITGGSADIASSHYIHLNGTGKHIVNISGNPDIRCGTVIYGNNAKDQKTEINISGGTFDCRSMFVNFGVKVEIAIHFTGNPSVTTNDHGIYLNQPETKAEIIFDGGTFNNRTGAGDNIIDVNQKSDITVTFNGGTFNTPGNVVDVLISSTLHVTVNDIHVVTCNVMVNCHGTADITINGMTVDNCAKVVSAGGNTANVQVKGGTVKNCTDIVFHLWCSENGGVITVDDITVDKCLTYIGCSQPSTITLNDGEAHGAGTENVLLKFWNNVNSNVTVNGGTYSAWRILQTGTGLGVAARMHRATVIENGQEVEKEFHLLALFAGGTFTSTSRLIAVHDDAQAYIRVTGGTYIANGGDGIFYHSNNTDNSSTAEEAGLAECHFLVTGGTFTAAKGINVFTMPDGYTSVIIKAAEDGSVPTFNIGNWLVHMPVWGNGKDYDRVVMNIYDGVFRGRTFDGKDWGGGFCLNNSGKAADIFSKLTVNIHGGDFDLPWDMFYVSESSKLTANIMGGTMKVGNYILVKPNATSDATFNITGGSIVANCFARGEKWDGTQNVATTNILIDGEDTSISSNGYVFYFYDGHDVDIDIRNGKLAAGPGSSFAYLIATTSVVKMSGGEIVSCKNAFDLAWSSGRVAGDAKYPDAYVVLYITGGTVNASGAIVNQTGKNGRTAVEITGGTFNAVNGIYLQSEANVEMDVLMTDGTVNLQGNFVYAGGISDVSGIAATIRGGTVTCGTTLFVTNGAGLTVNAEGGTLSGAVLAQAGGDNLLTLCNLDNFTLDVDADVAGSYVTYEDGDNVVYTNLTGAVNNAPADATVTVVGDMTLTNTAHRTKGNLTIVGSGTFNGACVFIVIDAAAVLTFNGDVNYVSTLNLVQIPAASTYDVTVNFTSGNFTVTGTGSTGAIVCDFSKDGNTTYTIAEGATLKAGGWGVAFDTGMDTGRYEDGNGTKTVTMTGGYLSGSHGITVGAGGVQVNVTVSGGTIETVNDNFYFSNMYFKTAEQENIVQLTITGGRFHSTSQSAQNISTVSNACLNAVISGGTFTTPSHFMRLDATTASPLTVGEGQYGHSVTLSDNVVVENDGYIIRFDGAATSHVSITGGSFTTTVNASNEAAFSTQSATSKAVIDISGGEFTSMLMPMIGKAGITVSNISGGTFHCSYLFNMNGKDADQNHTITGGTFYCTNTIITDGTAGSDITVNIKGGTITAQSVYVGGMAINCDVNVTGGTLIINGYTLDGTDATVKNVVRNETTGKEYTSLTAAVAEAQDGDVLTLLADTFIQDVIAISGKSITITGGTADAPVRVLGLVDGSPEYTSLKLTHYNTFNLQNGANVTFMGYVTYVECSVVPEGDDVILTFTGNVKFDNGNHGMQVVYSNSKIYKGDVTITVAGNAHLIGNWVIDFEGDATSGDGVKTIVMTGGLLEGNYGIVFNVDGQAAVLKLHGGKIVTRTNDAIYINDAGVGGTRVSVELRDFTIEAAGRGLHLADANTLVDIVVYSGTLIHAGMDGDGAGDYCINLGSNANANPSTLIIYGGTFITDAGDAAINVAGGNSAGNNDASEGPRAKIYGGYFEGHTLCAARASYGGYLYIWGGYFNYVADEDNYGSPIRSGSGTYVGNVYIYGGNYETDSAGAPFNCANNVSYLLVNIQGVNAIGGQALVTTSNKNSGTQDTLYGEGSEIADNGISMVDGAGVRIVAGSNGLRFVSIVTKDALDYIASIGGTNLKFGTLIAPADIVAESRTFTMFDMDAAGLPYLNIAAKDGLVKRAAGGYYIRAAITNIQEGNIGREFAAVGYIQYEVDGQVVTMYTTYREQKNARSIAQVARLALQDGDIYTDAQREILKQFAPEGEAPVIDFYLVAGQSNAAGSSYFSEAFSKIKPEFTEGYSHVLYSGVALTGSPYMNRNDFFGVPTRIGYGSMLNSMGPELGMADALSQYYNEETGRYAAIIKYAYGGTKLYDAITGTHTANGSWTPPSWLDMNEPLGEQSGGLFRGFVNHIASCVSDYKAMGFDVNIVAAYWMQGESDVAAYLQDGLYDDIFKCWISDLRSSVTSIMKDEKYMDLPILVGEISEYFNANAAFENYMAFVQMQREVIGSWENVYVIPQGNIPTADWPSDNAHWGSHDHFWNGQMVGYTALTKLLGQELAPVEDPVAEIWLNGELIGSYESLRGAISMAPDGAVVKLLKDIEIYSTLSIGNRNQITLDGGNHRVDFKPDETDVGAYSALKFNHANITIRDLHVVNHTPLTYGAYIYYNSKITWIGGSIEAERHCFVLNSPDCELNIVSGDFNNRTANITYAGVVFTNNNAKITIDGGTFNGGTGTSYAVYADAASSAVITLNGGTFIAGTTATYVIWQNSANATLIVKEGVELIGGTAGQIHNVGKSA